MERFQLGLNFIPVNRTEIASQLHGQFEPVLIFSQIYIYPLQQTRAKMSSWPEIIQYITKGNIPLVWAFKTRLVDYLTCVILWLHIKY